MRLMLPFLIAGIAVEAGRVVRKQLDPSAPQCAQRCLSIKLGEASEWFGSSDFAYYCTQPAFLTAHTNCVNDHCEGQNITLGIQAGTAACLAVASPGSGAPSMANSTTNTPIRTSQPISGATSSSIPSIGQATTAARSGSLSSNTPSASASVSSATRAMTISVDSAASINLMGFVIAMAVGFAQFL